MRRPDDDHDLRIAGRSRHGRHDDAEAGDEDEGDGDGGLSQDELQGWTRVGVYLSRLAAGLAALNRGMVPRSLAP